MRRAFLVLILLPTSLLMGCSQDNGGPSGPPPKMAPPQNRQAQAAPMSVEEIGKNAFGSAFHSARVEGKTAAFEYAPHQDGTPEQNYKRIYLMASTAIPTAFNHLREVQTLHFTAVDEK